MCHSEPRRVWPPSEGFLHSVSLHTLESPDRPARLRSRQSHFQRRSCQSGNERTIGNERGQRGNRDGAAPWTILESPRRKSYFAADRRNYAAIAVIFRRTIW